MTEPQGQEDRRSAANLAVTLSGLVVTAALAVLGAQAVVVTFVIDRRDDLLGFYAVSVCGMVALVASIVLGGRGIWEIVSGGFDGAWRVTTQHGKFNFQAILALVGAILVATSAFLGDPKPPTP